MDVRCEKCQTEYELDEARLKPGGVTVKCTNCGHMFKIRKRSPTQPGAPIAPPRSASPSAPPPRPTERPTERRSTPEPRTAPPAVPEPSRTLAGSGPVGEGDRNWIIRLENGETRTCRELNALQQWIIAGEVSRESMISRSGKTWKRLGDIPDLASFFIVAEEARQSRSSRESGSITPPRMPAVPEPRPTIAGMGAVQPPGKAPERETVVEPVRAATARPAPPPTPPPVPPPRPPSVPAVLAVPPLPAPAPTPLAIPIPPAPPIPSQRPTGAWANDAIAPTIVPDPSGGPMGGAVRPPTAPGGNGGFGGETFGGVVRPVATGDAAFTTSGRLGEVDDSFDPFLERKKSGAGLWIALGSLVVIGAAAAVVYFMFLRPPKNTDEAGVDPAAAADGGAVAVTADGGVTPDAPAAAAVDRVAEARAQLARDVAPGLIAAEKALADGTDAASLGMRARLLTAQAQIIEDEAALATDPKNAEKIRRDAKKLQVDALALAQRSIKAGGAGAVIGNVAMADVLRLQGKPAKDVARYLDAARQSKPTPEDTLELQLVAAQLALRDKDARAEALVKELDSGPSALEQSGDVRGRWLAARMAFAAKNNAAAKTAADSIVGLVADHAGARALAARLGGVDGTDPMPPEVGSGSGSEAGSGSGTGASPGSGSGSGSGGGSSIVVPSGDGYDRLVAKADKLAEVDCGQAMQYYAKALEEKPAGVEALIGMGYCHIDAKAFSSAQSKFRTALALSPRNKDALRGVAEGYQQQGRTDLAIEAYKRYLEIYPDDERIKRVVDRLGGGVPGPSEPENGGGAGTGSSGSGAGGDKPSEPAGDPAPPSDPGKSDTPPTTP